MLDLIYNWLLEARTVVILAMTVLGLIAAGWAWFAPRHGSSAAGLGKLFGLVLFLAFIAVLGTLVDLAKNDLTGSGGGSTPPAPAVGEVGN